METVSFRNARNLRVVGLLHRADPGRIVRPVTPWYRERL